MPEWAHLQVCQSAAAESCFSSDARFVCAIACVCSACRLCVCCVHCQSCFQLSSDRKRERSAQSSGTLIWLRWHSCTVLCVHEFSEHMLMWHKLGWLPCNFTHTQTFVWTRTHRCLQAIIQAEGTVQHSGTQVDFSPCCPCSCPA